MTACTHTGLWSARPSSKLSPQPASLGLPVSQLTTAAWQGWGGGGSGKVQSEEVGEGRRG